MDLRFSKMHGCGNDFVVIERLTQYVRLDEELVRKLADRRFGIGCDQLLVVDPPDSPDTDFRYRIFNADGQEVEQCGNGARCFARFVQDRQFTGKSRLQVGTAAGTIELHLTRRGQVRVDMGKPSLEPADIPLQRPERQIHYPLTLDGNAMDFGAVSMGNPHAVFFVDDTDNADLEVLGPAVQSLPEFPNSVNVGVATVVNRGTLRLRVYERGVGETLACGTGACAAVVAGIQRDLLGQHVKVQLPGGELTIEWSGEGHPVIMTGPAERVFDGVYRLPAVKKHR